MLGLLRRLFQRSGSAPQRIDWETPLVRLGLRPIMADMGGWVALTASGDVVSGVHDSIEPPERVTDQRMRNAALEAASRRYSDLAGLAPRRGPRDRDCPHCGGTGRVVLSDGREAPQGVSCYCGGLGWLPADYPQGGA